MKSRQARRWPSYGRARVVMADLPLVLPSAAPVS
jgi:hypothetical protein